LIEGLICDLDESANASIATVHSPAFWIERLIPGEGRQAFVNPQHRQELDWCSGGAGWEQSVGGGTPETRHFGASPAVASATRADLNYF
jgi:hypothetical protein